jgi:hypothetical protein
MAFVTNLAGNVISFADSFDVRDIEQRIFEANEINFQDAASPAFATLDDYIDNLLEKSTDRLLLKIKASSWWNNYNSYVGTSISDSNVIPDVNPDRILRRQQDFTDMCVFYCLKEYLLPKTADFGIEESSEVQKIKYYDNKYTEYLNELLAIADWYDADGDGTVEDNEQLTTFRKSRRTRGKGYVTRIR